MMPRRSRPRARLLALAAACMAPILAAAAPALAAGPQDPPPAAARAGEPVEVVVWNRPLAELRATLGSADPAERARAAVQRIEGIPVRDLRRPVEVREMRIGGADSFLVAVGPQPVVFLVPDDLPPGEEGGLPAYARQVAERLQEVLDARHRQGQPSVILAGAGLSLLATLLLALAVLGILKLRYRALGSLGAPGRDRKLAVAGVDVAPLFFAVLRGVARVVTFGVGAAAVFAWLAFVLFQFPYTEPWGRSLGSHLAGLLGQIGSAVVGALPGLAMAAAIFLLARMAARGLSGFFLAVEEGRITPPWLEPETAKATRRIFVVIVWVLAFTLAFPYIPGSHTEAFRGASVLIGLMVSLGSAGLVNQVMSGFVIVYSRALKPGDFVRIGDTEGSVLIVGTLSTKVLTLRHEEITLPNALVVSQTIVNYSRFPRETGAVLSAAVTIGYDAPWRQVHALLLDAAGRVAAVRKEPRPFVLQRALSDFFVEYELRFHVDRPEERGAILSDLHGAVQDVFNDAGLQIMSPHYEGQPAEKVWVPPGRRDPGKTAPMAGPGA